MEKGKFYKWDEKKPETHSRFIPAIKPTKKVGKPIFSYPYVIDKNFTIKR